MAHRKLERFEELKTFSNVRHMPFSEASSDAFSLKGKWNSDFFSTPKPLVLELGCGKGEYTVSLASKYPEKNFLGVDIKGNRIWRGAKECIEKGIRNAGFLRTRIDFIDKAFGHAEVTEIWITFPDPQKEKKRKRLTHPMFLERYRRIAVPGATLHLKTDSVMLHEYTLSVIRDEKLELEDATGDLYTMQEGREDVCAVQTFYEKMYLSRGMPITYLRFRL